MAQARKTQKTEQSVNEFLETITDPVRQSDAIAMVAMMKEVTATEPRMWGGSLVGFGDDQYLSANGKSNDWFRLGFSPRKSSVTIYGMGRYQGDELSVLGKHELSGGCLHIKSLADVDLNILKTILGKLWA